MNFFINLNNLYLLLYICIKKRESLIPSPLFYCSLIKANNCSAALRGPECSWPSIAKRVRNWPTLIFLSNSFSKYLSINGSVWSFNWTGPNGLAKYDSCFCCCSFSFTRSPNEYSFSFINIIEKFEFFSSFFIVVSI